MGADEALAAGDGVEEGLFAFGRDGRRAVEALFGAKIALGLEEKGVELAEVLGKKDAAVLFANDFVAVLGGRGR